MAARWYVFYSYRHPDTGKFQRFREWIPASKRTRSERYEYARSRMKVLNQRLASGFNPFCDQDRSGTNILVALDIAYDLKKSATRRRSYLGYKSRIKYLKQYLAAKRMNKLRISDFNKMRAQDFLDWYRMKRDISNRTYNNLTTDLHAIFAILKSRYYIVVNPFDDLETLESEETSLSFFSAEERRIINEYLPGHNYRLYLIAQLIFTCFLRPQEICRLKFKHLNLDAGVISVPGDVSKNHKNEMITMPRGMMQLLTNMPRNYPDDFYIFSTKLFPGTKEIFPTRIAEFFGEFADIHHIRRTIYSLKHTGNGLALEAGIDIRDLQLHNRHHNLAQTQKYIERYRKSVSDKLINKFPEL